MSDEQWQWEYDPNRECVTTGLPEIVIAEVEKIAEDLVTLGGLGFDITDIGEGRHHGVPGGVRRLPLTDHGWVHVLPAPRLRLVAVIHITPPFKYL
ncbi:hypothetical protein QZH56_20430 [Streptomyces olivoreticuli]|uniref:hypothetical protein n=1 Tax=Streptomyces olivoreticuli TaxID=68246 RepID=UPI002659A034|nr:hypothetical protein [Streptomyces olivoreticuli]WKK21233.1 hypothetical protein QZH56_20430 [Streptomyces olivoreticuli]